MTIDRRNVPVTIRGKDYPSHSAAGKDLGVTRAAISMAKRQGRLDTVGTLRRPIEVDGEAYASLSDAAKATGLSIDKIRILVEMKGADQ